MFIRGCLTGWIWLRLIIAVSFMLIGGGGFLYRAWNWGKSAEHSAATADRTRPLNFLVSLEYILEVFCDGAPSETANRVRRVSD